MIRRGKAKVGQLDGHATIRHEDILRLEVAMVDLLRMAVIDGIQDLEKDRLGEVVVAEVTATLGDVGEEVAVGTVLDNDKGAVGRVHDLDERGDVWVLAGLVVELNLSLLEALLARFETNLAQGLDGKRHLRDDVSGRVDDTVGAHAEQAGQFEATGQNETKTVLGSAESIPDGRGRRRGKHSTIDE